MMYTLVLNPPGSEPAWAASLEGIESLHIGQAETIPQIVSVRTTAAIGIKRFT
jgi:hypothetical protein